MDIMTHPGKLLSSAFAFLMVLSVRSGAANFDPAGWETNSSFPLIGDPAAVKGGILREHWTSFPPTLRSNGPNAGLPMVRDLHQLVFESLVATHPGTLETIPRLATHWKVSPDQRRFWFRIDPKARWADGSPVTAEDAVATWDFLVRKDLHDPYSGMIWGENFERPVADGPQIVSVKTRKPHWRLFLQFGGMPVYPAKELAGLDGERYLREYDWKLQMGSGPYELRAGAVRKDRSVTLTRRPDYWGKDERWNIGVGNFDALSFNVVLDDSLAFERFKKGELDYYFVAKAQRWVQECDFDRTRKGWIQKRRIRSEAPQGFTGFAFNMRKPPFDDRDVRKAFALLVNRERLVDKLFFDEYVLMDSYFPGSAWSAPDIPPVRYDPRMAARLLERAGWKQRDKNGWLVKDGKPLSVTLEYGNPSWTRIHKVLQEDIAGAGIRLELRLIDSRTLIQKVDERNFTLHFQTWGAQLFPNPETYWSSRLAGEKHNDNLPGFRDPRADALLERYDAAFDPKERGRILRELDGLILRQHPYALGWYVDASRILFWNRYGHPKDYLHRTGDYRDVRSLWWLDPVKAQALEEAQRSGKSLPVEPTDVDPWPRSPVTSP